MDILAHTLWTNAGARGANKLREKKGKPKAVHVGWTAFWGVFPDFFAFTIPFVVAIFKIITGQSSASSFGPPHISTGGFDLAAYLYQWSHSIVIFALVFIIVSLISKRPRYELFGWALHILIDIPSHDIEFYATPFLWPISEYRFPYGISWANKWFMIINYSALVLVWGGILISKLKKKKSTQV
jgi:hypothetical protein